MASSISGAAETIKALEGLKKSTASGVLARALKKAARPIEAAARAAAPLRSGKLKRSIGTKIIRHSAGKAAFAAAKASGATSAEAGAAARAANSAANGAGLSAVARVSATAPHAFFVEVGTQAAPAQPFLGPAFRSKSEAALASIKSEIAHEVAATAKRVAARAAKKVKIQ